MTVPQAELERTRIITFALTARLPTIFYSRDFVQAGALMSYGPNYANELRRAADLVDRIPGTLSMSGRASLHLRPSKTDHDGQGRKIGIPFGRTRWCPAAAIDSWLTASAITAGAVFRPLDRHGRIQGARLPGSCLSRGTVLVRPPAN